MKGDNFRLLDRGEKLPVVKLLKDIEAGTAVIPMPAPGGEVMAVEDGKIVYRSLSGDIYEAKLLHHASGLALIEVFVPGCAEPVRLSNIKLGYLR